MKKEQLLDVASNLRRLANSIAVLADADTGKNVAETDKPVSPEITLEQVRAILADKSRSGKTAKVRELLLSFGAERLSEIDQTRYAEVLEAAEAF